MRQHPTGSLQKGEIPIRIIDKGKHILEHPSALATVRLRNIKLFRPQHFLTAEVLQPNHLAHGVLPRFRTDGGQGPSFLSSGTAPVPTG
ncbi:hypothetical protein JQ615_31140 [Bradyrhizobium jicamae]|uniref:Uncharacterized protein n=1 Tax=Bradyrhizobium jicamae TaxID=280332 RepID=A0ABS5FSN4_9BRAD|nr:hypothetical protein [Bradyrhizobium jicamae]MBR0799833.1 hypothetical protein [Bradyrhizobium jicamae]MBR0939298.1 hypothetical protein [Bradyrhizobium jicamae]